MKDLKKLNVWEKAHNLTLEIYKNTKMFPNEELFGITSQLRRASSSIATNIAEGSGRSTDADFARFIQISIGSTSEVEYLLILSHNLKYIEDKIYTNLVNEIIDIRRMLVGLIKHLKR